MQLKLGELLLQQKLITAEQLKEALHNQVVYGIRLGSALMEMGYVEEKELVQVLSETLGVPFVAGHELAAIPKEIIDEFSQALVIRYQVMPFKLERNRLGLAMTNPNDFKAIEEIAFITGRIVQPYISPDICISHAQARYYRFSEGETRYQQITRSGTDKDQARTNKNETVKITATQENGEKLNVYIPVEFEDFAFLHSSAEEDGAKQEKRLPNSFERTCVELAEAHTPDDAAEILIGYIGAQFGTGALFAIKGDQAEGWRGMRQGTPIENIREMRIVMTQPSVLKDIAATGKFFLGQLASTAENEHILKTINLTKDAPLFVAPIIIMDKPIAAALVLAETEELGPRLNRLQMLIKKMTLVFEMLTIKNKILRI